MSDKVVDYEILKECSTYDLENLIRYRLTRGYQPQGGVVYDGKFYIQAVVRTEPQEEPKVINVIKG